MNDRAADAEDLVDRLTEEGLTEDILFALDDFHGIDFSGVPDQILETFSDVVMAFLNEAHPSGVPEAISESESEQIARSAAALLAPQIRAAEEDTTTKYWVWAEEETIAGPLSCREALARRRELEEQDDGEQPTYAVYPESEAPWEGLNEGDVPS